MRRAPALALLLVAFAAVADPYDDAVGRAFPGFHIMGPSEIGLVESQTSPALYAEVKDHPGLIVGDFDGDGRADFAALIRQPTKQRDTYSEYYDGHLAACYGGDGGKFDCVSIASAQIHLPYAWFLAAVRPGKHTCHGSRTHDTQDPGRRDRSGGESTLTTTHAAIGKFRVMGNGDVMYVYQSRTRYTLCILGD
jgi:hypothetical protein